MFAPLDTKTVYSFMDSVIDLRTYIDRAKDLGYSHVGIMDKDNLYAGYHFIKMAEQAGLTGVLGLDCQIDFSGQLLSTRLLALSSKGYQNLMKISTEIMSDNHDYSLLEAFFEDICLIIPHFQGIETLNLNRDFYIGVDLETEETVFSKPILPLYTIRYFSNEDRETIQVLHAIKDNLPLREVKPVAENQLLFPMKTMEQAFLSKFPESIDNLGKVISSIHYDFDSNLKLPRFNRQKDAYLELREKTQAGLEQKGLWLADYQERLERELAVIHKMGFDDYFLIVWDLLRFGRSQGYYMGMGRGSAAGSLVAYSLDITGIDPVKHNLLFERFLNEERYSMPDIDIDLPDVYRSEFLHYVRDRYGRDHAAQIVTFSTFGAKQAVRDVFKRFGAAEYELSNLTKKIGFRDNLTSVYEKNASFRQLVNSKAEYQRAYSIAKKLEGRPRQTSIHAAGIVMSDDLLTDHIPLKPGEDMMVTQYDAGAVEANGLLKMDFLGLRNLTFVQRMKELLLSEQGIDIDIASIDLEDQETLKLFAAGNTKGIFQFEQAGAINLLKRIKPRRFEEVVATTSLNRPGASDYIDNFINRKFGREEVDLIDPTIASILEPTYGIMLYQEQVMQIAQVYAGFTLGKADLLRRAMSKKDASEMHKMSADFYEGAQRLNRNPQTTERLFTMMEKFAGYGFNRSHAFAYSALAFQLAYFKCHYPAIFYNVMLNYSSSDYITDALNAQFEVQPLSINQVPYMDKLSEGRIYLGLNNLKPVPRDLAYWILENRPFQNMEDFLSRLPEKYQKEEFLVPMIQVGLFDQFDSNRRKLIENLSSLITFVSELGSLFADLSYNWIEAEDFSNLEKYQAEKEILGIGISPHPLKELLKQGGAYQMIGQVQANQQATLLVQLDKLKIIRTKSNGQQMAFATVTDTQSTIEVTIFPETFHHYSQLLKEGGLYYMTGKIQERDGKNQMILGKLEQASLEKLWLLIENHQNDQAIARVLAAFPGHLPVVLHYKETGETIQSQTYFVMKNDEIQNELQGITLKTVFR
ncbi:DNA polymerase III subunit alpha [Streptococcus loxodontisalivarius]|uniref:DNA polymerase III subunit alpha n=1 Tax=Streptococcus loxodontisalivarius TaxID=1349415 RepID=A0ABS2PP54_9STRE|nr:DNA polymerase III subunit alpha [Streptococcus loxodontisalivarius]MBM7641807.1 DNA polymerase-3 subunit alpha [Streptococcus loxodontisalivarius]